MPTSTPSTSVDTAALAAHLRLSITRLARQLRQRGGDGTLTPSQLSVLAMTGARGPLTMGELAEAERVASPTVTKIAAALHDRGLLDRETDADDRRVVRVAVTPKGAKLLERDRARKTAWLARQLERLSDDDLNTLDAANEVLERLTNTHTDR